MPELSITRHENRVTVVGDIRAPADRDRLREHIIAALADLVDYESADACDDVILDVSQAAYLDTAALTSLIMVSRRCIDVGARLVLEGANADLLEQLRITGIDRVLGAHGARVTPADNSDSTGATL